MIALIFGAGCSDSNEPNFDAVLLVENQRGLPVVALRTADCGDPNWGKDRLEGQTAIPTGGLRTIDVESGCLDVLVEFADGSTAELTDIEVGEDESDTILLAPIDDGTLTVENGTSLAITELNFSPCDDVEWGPDRLTGGATVEPGQSQSFAVQADCYDIRVFLDDGQERVLFDAIVDDGTEFVWTVE